MTSLPVVLFAANFPTGTGYAWQTIERVFSGVATRLGPEGLLSAVCYPSLPHDPPAGFEAAGIEVLEFDYQRTKRPAGVLEFARLLRRRRIELLYLTDQPTWSPRYALFRLAGVRHIVLHSRSSGERTNRSALARLTKPLLHRIRPLAVDLGIAVSDFVARRMVLVNGLPAARVVRVYNGIDFAPFDAPVTATLQDVLGRAPDTQVVFSSGRATPLKGIPVLIEAAAVLEQRGRDAVHVAYAGDGPALDSFRDEVARRGLRRFHFLGRRDDVPSLLRSAAVAVIPSVWAEAFGLTVVEAMAAARPLVASRTGGIPELVEDGVTGLLVEPGDPAALAAAIERCLDDPVSAAAMGRRAAAVARERFSIERVAREVTEAILGLGHR